MGKHTTGGKEMFGPCTVSVDARGGKCGKPGITGWTNGAGEDFAECYGHALPCNGGTLHERGREVTISRHGKDYLGRVARVSPTGIVWVEVTYDNGTTKVVRL
jgi:hypothetical protein